MDTELALLLIEEDLLKMSKLDPSRLDEFKEAIVVAAGTPEGYSGLAWKGGAHLVELAQQLGKSSSQFFSEFGWRALANGLQSGIQNKQSLSALSFADTSFIPPSEKSQVFEQAQITEAIDLGFKKTPRSFIKPAELSAATPAVQSQFGALLSCLPGYNLSNELILQWSSSALRVLPPQSDAYFVAGINLLQILQAEGRIASAYYSFRAIGEQRSEVWSHPITVSLIGTFIRQFWQQEMGNQILIEMVIDDDVFKNSVAQFDLLVMAGMLAIALTRQDFDEQIESAAWRFINEIFVMSAVLASVLTEYLADGILPLLPPYRSEQISHLNSELNAMISSVEQELRPRKYRPLANRIYQTNIREVFTPLLHQIRSDACSPALVAKINQIDPEELVTGSDLLKASPDELGRRVLSKMVSDNQRMLEALENAASKKIELNQALAEWNNGNSAEYQVYQEIETLYDVLDHVSINLWAALLPELKQRFDSGIAIMKKDQEARQHAAW